MKNSIQLSGIKNSTITINGKTFTGSELSSENGNIIIDGNNVGSTTEVHIHMTDESTIKSLFATNLVIHGNVNGNVDGKNISVNGSVNGNIEGKNINVSGNVSNLKL